MCWFYSTVDPARQAKYYYSNNVTLMMTMCGFTRKFTFSSIFSLHPRQPIITKVIQLDVVHLHMAIASTNTIASR